ncbi:uncharacterized protein METZ01_LOCUS494551, partial [marine metagenome]
VARPHNKGGPIMDYFMDRLKEKTS